MPRETPEYDDPAAARTYVFEGLSLADLTANLVAAHSASAENSPPPSRQYLAIQPETLIINDGTFSQPSAQAWFPTVVVSQTGENLRVSCPCAAAGPGCASTRRWCCWRCCTGRSCAYSLMRSYAASSW